MNDEILIINEYPIGWGWLKDVPLIDWEWLIDVFATMTDDTDTYSYITYAEEDGAKLTDITFVRTVWEHYCKYNLHIHPSQATEEQYAYFLDCYSGDDQYTDLYTYYENQYPEYNHQLKHYGK
jgi:hypothetical protein